MLLNRTLLQAAESLAEFTHNEQKLERGRRSAVSMLFASFDANWPCMWGEEVTGGSSEAWKELWKEFKDGCAAPTSLM